MFKVFFLIVMPGMTWERIAEARRGYFWILATYLLPFIALDVALEGRSLIKWGKWQSHFQVMKEFTQATVIRFEIAHAVLLLAMILVSALLVWVAIENFQGRKNFLLVFTLVAYSYSPLLLANLLNYFPMMNPLLASALGIVMSVSVLYQGVPRVLKPDPSQAFGIYLSTAMVMFMVSGMVSGILGLYLTGYVDFQNSQALQRIGHWLGQ